MKLFGTRARRRAAGLTVIDERLSVRGDLDTDGTVRVDGHVGGASHRVGTLVVGPGGTVMGNVLATDVVVAGRVSGNIEATGRLEIERGARIEGDVRAGTLIIREGSFVSGQFQVVEQTAPTHAVELVSDARTHDVAA